MFIADAHCDTILKLKQNNQTIKESTCMLQIDSCPNLQFFACFVENHEGFDTAVDLINLFNQEMDFDTFSRIRSKYDFDENKVNALLCIENGRALDGKIENLFTFYDMGVRLMTLTWNGENELGGGDGLSDFGRAVVKEMNKLNMIIDLSHASGNLFWDVCKITNKPIVATHSNSKAICHHSRNLTDEQIKEIISKNGFIGLNFYPEFLGENSDIGLIIRHAWHIIELGGENVLGFGSDFDGINDLPKGVSGSGSYFDIVGKFIEVLGEELAKKIAGENLLRFVMKNL